MEKLEKFIVYEVWTRHRTVEARNFSDAYHVGAPEPIDGLSLCNWHVAHMTRIEGEPLVGALNVQSERGVE